MSEKELEALKTVKRYMWWSMGAGVIPVPVVNLVAVSGVQLKMLAEISKIYGVPFQENRGKAITGALTGFLAPQAISTGLVGNLLRFVPVVGPLATASSMVLFCAASAWALGKVFIEHFESGGTLLSFDPEKMREHFRAEYEQGRKVAGSMRTKPADVPV